MAWSSVLLWRLWQAYVGFRSALLVEANLLGAMSAWKKRVPVTTSCPGFLSDLVMVERFRTGARSWTPRTFILICEAVFWRYLPCSSLSDLCSLTLDSMIECFTRTIIASVCWVPISIAVGSQLPMSHVSVKKTCFCYNQLPGFLSDLVMVALF